jgi:hypothetical protein
MGDQPLVLVEGGTDRMGDTRAATYPVESLTCLGAAQLCGALSSAANGLEPCCPIGGSDVSCSSRRATAGELLPRHPETDWKCVSGMGDVISHHCFGIGIGVGVDADVVLPVCRKHFPSLRRTLETILGHLDSRFSVDRNRDRGGSAGRSNFRCLF